VGTAGTGVQRSLQAGFLYYLSGVAASKLPGYDDAPFGIYDREAFSR
jgi:hypothetical protein